MSLTSFAVLAVPMQATADLSAQPGTDDFGVGDEQSIATVPSDVPPRLNDAAMSSRYYVSMTDPERVNVLLAMRGLPLVKGKQMPGMPMIRVMDLDPKTVSELEATPGVGRILPYMTPYFDDPVPDGQVAPTSRPSTYDFSVDEIQGATGAWSLGYTGAGVKIAVIDTGFDMGHPDLQGQQARYSSGPYAGWPIVYDDFSALVWSIDIIGGWVANTTATSNDTGGFVSYDNSTYSIVNLTDASGNPVASASGIYHIGYHTDWNLINKIGYPVGVLVVDATTPGVYDTVYVDLLGDLDFGDDKPCTKGDEISYFDSYNYTDETTQSAKWNAGDGFADVSGGMVYWISDGINTLPGANWTYGATLTPASGDAVAFVGEFSPGQSHGTMTASAALAAQRSMGGMLGGMAPDAKLICIPFTFDIYTSWQFAEYGADGLLNTGDEANIVSNSYGWSEAAIDAGYEYIDQEAGRISLSGTKTLWLWAAGNGGPGYGTTGSVVDFSSVRVGAGTSMQYRAFLSQEWGDAYSKWGDVAPFSNSGPTRTGKLNPEIIASGMYSFEPAPLNTPDHNGRTEDGSMHFQIGSGTSHAAPTVAGGAALGYQAYYARTGSWPDLFLAKGELMASADDLHFDPLKQGAGWLNATTYVKAMGRSDVTISTSLSVVTGQRTAALYPGKVYWRAYESFPNFLLPGEQDSNNSAITENLNISRAVTANISAQLLMKTRSALVNHTTTSMASEYLDITSFIQPGTDLVKVTMFIPLSVFDPNLDYISNVNYNLELADWVDLNGDGAINTTDRPELFRFSMDNGDCNYNQVMVRDPLERTHDGLVAGLRTLLGRTGLNISIQIDSYELQPFPWIDFERVGDSVWTPTLSLPIPAGSNDTWNIRVSVPSDAPVGTYAAAIYIESEDRVQCMPVVINVPSPTYEFTFGEQSPFDTPYSNNFSGLANKEWRYDTGDWRMYWVLPSILPPNRDAYLMTSLEWSELPTTMNIYVLAAQKHPPLTFWGPLDPPFGPGWDMVPIARSDDHYSSGGVFGVGTNTGGPKVVVAAPVGGWISDSLLIAPFAILTRCPVMSGNSSEDHFVGTTAWVTVNGYEPQSIVLHIAVPGPTPLLGEINGTYNITTASPVVVKGGGTADLEKVWSFFEPIYQDNLTGNSEYDLAHAAYTYNIDVADVESFRVSIFEIFGAPELDLGLWLDRNRNGIAELSEPHWSEGILGSTEEIELQHPESGTYLIKVLGYQITWSPGYFYMIISESMGGYIEARGFESPVSSGEHNFTIAYNVTASPGTFHGEATFGFMGATDMFSIPVTITVIDQPVIQNLTPADGAILDTSDLEASFEFLDVAGANVGLDPSSVRILLDGIVSLTPWAVIVGNNVTLSYSFSLAQGWHSITVLASDLDGNAAEPVSHAFYVNSLIDIFSFAMKRPGTDTTIEDGATVSLSNVTVVGMTDPMANVTVVGESGIITTVANATGAFEMTVQLVEGLNVMTISTTNEVDRSASGVFAVISDTVCVLTVGQTPTLTGEDSEILTGATEPGVNLTVNGVAVPVSSLGEWTSTIALAEGLNTIFINATDPWGNFASHVLNITSDRTAPALAVSAPSDGSQLSLPTALISGTVEPGSSVSVNGVAVPTGETDVGTWSARIVLVNGTNVVTVVATDQAGNRAERTLTVVYVPPDYITPDEMKDALDGLNDTLQQDIRDADDFASLVMFIALILFLISVLFTGALWYVLGNRLKEAAKPGETEESLEEIEEERPMDVEREFEELEKEVRRDEGS